MSEKYTWDNAGDRKQLSMDQTLNEDNRSDYEAVFHILTHVFDNSNFSQELFAIDTWRAVICSFGHNASTCLRSFRLYGDQALMSCWDLKEHHIIIIIIKNLKGKISIEFPQWSNSEKSYFICLG